jgi:hypothetical protein
MKTGFVVMYGGKNCLNIELNEREGLGWRERGRGREIEDNWKDYDLVQLLAKMYGEFGYPVSDNLPRI